MEKEKPIVLSVDNYRENVARKPVKKNFLMKCVVCGKEFYAARRTALYCSDYCCRLFYKLQKKDVSMETLNEALDVSSEKSKKQPVMNGPEHYVLPKKK